MLKLHYGKEMLQRGIRENLEDLVSAFSKFHLFDDASREEMTNLLYIPKVIAIASNLGMLVYEEPPETPELFEMIGLALANQDYDPRRKPTNPDEKRLNELCGRLVAEQGVAVSGEAKFVMFNALLYLADQNINEFQVKEEIAERKELPDLRQWIGIDFDYLMIQVDAYSTDIGQAFMKGKKLYTRLTHDDLELYLLRKTYADTVDMLYRKRKANMHILFKENAFSVKRATLEKFVEEEVDRRIIGDMMKLGFLYQGKGGRIVDYIFEKVKKSLAEFMAGATENDYGRRNNYDPDRLQLTNNWYAGQSMFQTFIQRACSEECLNLVDVCAAGAPPNPVPGNWETRMPGRP